MFGLGLPELIVIFLVVFILFGAKALPEVAKGLGQAIKMFKKEVTAINPELPSSETAALKDGTKVGDQNDFKSDSFVQDCGSENDAREVI